MPAKENATDKTTWVPICCDHVMRHNVFQAENEPVATLVCVSCGKHLTLQRHTSGSIDQYGEGAHLLQVVSVARPFRNKSDGATAGDPGSEDTM
jgi:hypothetical protein